MKRFVAIVVLALVACSGADDAATPACRGEGERFGGKTIGPTGCCSGLTRLKIPYDEATCVAAVDGTFTCTHCGDDVCSDGENRCNCPTDCAR